MRGLVLGVPPGIGQDEFGLQGQPGHEPLAEAHAEVGRDRPQEGAVLGIVAPERMGTGRSEDKPVLAEGIGNHLEGIGSVRAFDEHVFRVGDHGGIPVHFPVILVLVVHLGGQRQGGQQADRDPKLVQHPFHGRICLKLFSVKSFRPRTRSSCRRRSPTGGGSPSPESDGVDTGG